MQLPYNCSVAQHLQTHTQRTYCEETPWWQQRPFEITDAARSGGAFIHVGCGSGWCRHHRRWNDYMWKLASADLSLQLLQVRWVRCYM